MKKTIIKWTFIYVIYCVCVFPVVLPFMVLNIMLYPFAFLVPKLEKLKWNLVRKYKP